MFHLCGHTEGAIDHLAGESQIIGRIAVMANGVHAAEGLYNFRHACQNICELAATLDRLCGMGGQTARTSLALGIQVLA